MEPAGLVSQVSLAGASEENMSPSLDYVRVLDCDTEENMELWEVKNAVTSIYTSFKFTSASIPLFRRSRSHTRSSAIIDWEGFVKESLPTWESRRWTTTRSWNRSDEVPLDRRSSLTTSSRRKSKDVNFFLVSSRIHVSHSGRWIFCARCLDFDYVNLHHESSFFVTRSTRNC